MTGIRVIGVGNRWRGDDAVGLEVAEAISSHRDLNALLSDLVQRVPRVVPFDYINLVLYDPDSKRVKA